MDKPKKQQQSKSKPLEDLEDSLVIQDPDQPTPDKDDDQRSQEEDYEGESSNY